MEKHACFKKMSSDFAQFIANIRSVLDEVEARASSNDSDLLSYFAARLEAALDGVRFLQHKFANSMSERMETDSESEDINRFLLELSEFERRLKELWSSLDDKVRSLEQQPFIVDVESRAEGSLGRPKYVIRKEQLEFLRFDLKFKWTEIASLLGVSVSTLARRRAEFGINSQQEGNELNDEDLDQIVRDFSRQQPYTGLTLLEGHIRRLNLRVSRERVRQSLLRVDPINVSLRHNQTITRRQYSVPGPNSLWHVDTNPPQTHTLEICCPCWH